MTDPRIIGTAKRTTADRAKRLFDNGGTILVHEFADREEIVVTRTSTVHNSQTTTWDTLTAMVRMWAMRYPRQTYYVVTFTVSGPTCAACGDDRNWCLSPDALHAVV